jgi:hypothetical protein
MLDFIDDVCFDVLGLELALIVGTDPGPVLTC